MAIELKHWAVLALAAAAAVPSVGRASDADPTPAEMMAQIKQLQAKVAQLEADRTRPSTTQPITTPTTPSDTAQTQRAVETDAGGRRSGPLESALMGGWDGNALTLRSPDNSFTLHPGLLLDVRNMTTYRERIPAKGGGETAGTGYDTQNGFDLSRFRLIAEGSLFDRVSYFAQLQADQGSSLSLLDAFASVPIGPKSSPFSFKVGQFKDPVFHERNLSEDNLMAVDRSLVESILGGGQTARIQGAGVVYDKDRLRGQLIVSDGFNSGNTKFCDLGGVGAGVTGGAGVTPTNFGASGRVEYLVIGERDSKFNAWREYNQFSSLHDEQDLLVVGGGVDFSQAGANDVYFHSVDLQYNMTTGLSIYAAYLGTYRDLNTNQGVKPGSYYDPGFVAQVAYVFGQHLEPFGRYDYVKLDPASTTGLLSHAVQEITVGANYYVYGRKLKFTVDGSWLPNGSPVDADALGILKDSSRNEFTLRTQFQFGI